MIIWLGNDVTFRDTAEFIKTAQPSVAHSRNEIERWLDLSYETGPYASEVFSMTPLEEREDDPT